MLAATSQEISQPSVKKSAVVAGSRPLMDGSAGVVSSLDETASEEDLANYPLQPDDTMFVGKATKSRIKILPPQKRTTRATRAKIAEEIAHTVPPSKRTRNVAVRGCDNDDLPSKKRLRASVSSFVDTEAMEVDGGPSDDDDLDPDHYDLNDDFIDDGPLDAQDNNDGPLDNAASPATSYKPSSARAVPITPTAKELVPTEVDTPAPRELGVNADLQTFFEKNKDLFLSFLRGAMENDLKVSPSVLASPYNEALPAFSAPETAPVLSSMSTDTPIPSTPPPKKRITKDKGKGKDISGLPTPVTPPFDARVHVRGHLSSAPSTPTNTGQILRVNLPDAGLGSPGPSSSPSVQKTPRKTIKDLKAAASISPASPSAVSSSSPSRPVRQQWANTPFRKCTTLPPVCQVTNVNIQDPLLMDFYHTLPPLTEGQLIPWSYIPGEGQTSFSAWEDVCELLDIDVAFSALNFVVQDQWVNPSRASPLDVELREVIVGGASRLNMYRGNSPAIGISTGYVSESFVLGAPVNSGVRQKFLSIIFHSQEWERFCGWVCMVFGRDAMHAQLAQDALKFSTRVESVKGQGSPASSSRKGMFVKNQDKDASSSKDFQLALGYDEHIPVYDSRNVAFDFSKNLSRMGEMLPRWYEEIPIGSFAVVGYTLVAYYSKKTSKWSLSTNVQWVVILASPSSSDDSVEDV
ncbi:hypothetical protein BJ165DRAFT_1406163 [Panaeolus papilionaceus]|nr:hypothetical protein BJ165DRAFT_1406163 [Panaeolus papilionaceus]